MMYKFSGSSNSLDANVFWKKKLKSLNTLLKKLFRKRLWKRGGIYVFRYVCRVND